MSHIPYNYDMSYISLLCSEMMKTKKTILFWIVVIYTTWLVGSTAFILNAPSYNDVGKLEKGCYTGDALILYVQCNGFAGSELLSKLVNIPFLLIQVVSIVGLPGIMLLFIPTLYIPWYLYKYNKRVKHASLGRANSARHLP